MTRTHRVLDDPPRSFGASYGFESIVPAVRMKEQSYWWLAAAPGIPCGIQSQCDHWPSAQRGEHWGLTTGCAMFTKVWTQKMNKIDRWVLGTHGGCAISMGSGSDPASEGRRFSASPPENALVLKYGNLTETWYKIGQRRSSMFSWCPWTEWRT
ncbi:hypothetical protein P167DRAFT_577887 [Morchella conica CCBAS932]|uniref:Uncharacterized protein n=1 Tax=Morchella conica CCBAS932 TaxID=1392247 RepID=A0A3N4KHC2_9PEZI|nr:hypothetical protein P167DRAFT_577887 [Morchella conica CCBAS932]